MRKERYLEKLELFEIELEFIASHDICDDVTERALLHSLQGWLLGMITPT